MTRDEQTAMPEHERGWDEAEAYNQLEQDPASLEGPNCPWDGRPHVVTTKTYGGAGRRIIAIGWRCKHCGNKWGWRRWWIPLEHA